EPQEYDEAEEYEALEEDESLYSTKKIDIEIYIPTEDESLYSTREIDLELYEPDDYAEDTESYYENAEEDIYEEGEAEYYASDEYYEDEYVNEEFVEEAYVDEEYIEEEYVNEEYDEDSFDIAYGDFEADYEPDDVLYEDDGGEELLGFWQRVKMRLSHLTAFDAVLASTGVVVLVVAFVILSMFLQSRQINKQIEALAPLGNELKEMGIVGGDGLFAMTDAALSGNFAQTADQEELNAEDTSSIEVIDIPESTKVNVSFVSVEKDLKIRFTDVNTGELITGTVFEVTLTNAAGKQLVLTDDDMDGIIYAQNVNAGVFDAVVTSTDKYKFPAIAQQVTVKDKVEYVVINVQDEVKTEKQINVAAEDTEKNVAAAEAEILKDTVEWVESTKTPVSGSESYLLVDKNTIADPSQVSKAAARMLFDTLSVTLEPSNVTLSVGSSIDLKGKEFANVTEGDIEYQYTA
ncbi:MAG: hypothetical protein K2H91_09810, partial [Lachnospiraceae bacterium]|nr:hypothetical protein [Lachnospiraceae bacterium]